MITRLHGSLLCAKRVVHADISFEKQKWVQLWLWGMNTTGRVRWSESWYYCVTKAMCSLEGLMLKLKLQYFGHLMRRVDSLEKTLMLGGIVGSRKRGWQRMKWLNGITNSMDMSLSELRELVRDREAWNAAIPGSQRVGHDWATELNWTELEPEAPFLLCFPHFIFLVTKAKILIETTFSLSALKHLWKLNF